MPAIDLLMKEVGVESNQLEKIVVAKGPGSYTGVRIGLTTAKTLAWALNVPLIGVSSLESLAYQARFYNGLFVHFSTPDVVWFISVVMNGIKIK